jgi:hypothetical protein
MVGDGGTGEGDGLGISVDSVPHPATIIASPIQNDTMRMGHPYQLANGASERA